MAAAVHSFQNFTSYSHEGQIGIEVLSRTFGDYHFVSVPLGIIGLLSVIKFYTRSSSSLLTLAGFYLLSLIPVVSYGVFVGTALLGMFIGTEFNCFFVSGCCWMYFSIYASRC